MKLACIDEGPHNAGTIPLVLLHAYPMDARMWRNQVDEFSARRRVVAPDFRGYGGSVHYPDEPFSVSNFAGDVLETLDALGISKAVFAGCSMGGYVIFELWRRAPERISGLVLCDTRAEADDGPTREKRAQQIQTMQQKGSGFLAGFVEENQVSPHTRTHNQPLVQKLKAWALGAVPGAPVRTIQMLEDRPDSFSTLPGITVPTMVVVGEDDTITPLPMAQVMAHCIPNSKLQTIRNAGHLSPIENPGEVIGAIVSVLREVDNIQ